MRKWKILLWIKLLVRAFSRLSRSWISHTFENMRCKKQSNQSIKPVQSIKPINQSNKCKPIKPMQANQWSLPGIRWLVRAISLHAVSVGGGFLKWRQREVGLIKDRWGALSTPAWGAPMWVGWFEAGGGLCGWVGSKQVGVHVGRWVGRGLSDAEKGHLTPTVARGLGS